MTTVRAVPIREVPTEELRRLAGNELNSLLEPNDGLSIDSAWRGESASGSRRPWPAIAEAIRRLEGGIVINGAILVGGTWEIDIDVHGHVTGHRYVKGSEPKRRTECEP